MSKTNKSGVRRVLFTMMSKFKQKQEEKEALFKQKSECLDVMTEFVESDHKIMSDDAEQQTEEIEVLKSIYEGDDNFKQVDTKTYQYKYIDGDKSFILEIIWGPTYPTDKPSFNMEIFYNQSLLPSVKEKVLSIVNAEAEQWLGCAMTYTLFECLKEHVSDILSQQTEEVVVSSRVEKLVIEDQNDTTKKPEKKEQLTKAQKRRAWDKAEIGRAGEKPRGYDWVDIVKHLSQAPHQPPAS